MQLACPVVVKDAVERPWISVEVELIVLESEMNICNARSKLSPCLNTVHVHKLHDLLVSPGSVQVWSDKQY